MTTGRINQVASIGVAPARMVGNRIFRTRTGRPGGSPHAPNPRELPRRVCRHARCLLTRTWRTTCVTSGSSETSTAWWKPGWKHSLQAHEDAFWYVGNTGNVISRPGNRMENKGDGCLTVRCTGHGASRQQHPHYNSHTLAFARHHTTGQSTPRSHLASEQMENQVTQCPHR